MAGESNSEDKKIGFQTWMWNMCCDSMVERMGNSFFGAPLEKFEQGVENMKSEIKEGIQTRMQHKGM